MFRNTIETLAAFVAGGLAGLLALAAFFALIILLNGGLR